MSSAEVGKLARPKEHQKEMRQAYRLIGGLDHYSVSPAILQRSRLGAAVEAKRILPRHAVIATIALEHKLVLATGNPKEYPVRGLKFLRLPKR